MFHRLKKTIKYIFTYCSLFCSFNTPTLNCIVTANGGLLCHIFGEDGNILLASRLATIIILKCYYGVPKKDQFLKKGLFSLTKHIFSVLTLRDVI
jgi:hypothetical protein